MLMKSWRADAFGKPEEVLRLQEIEVPEPPEKNALVRVIASGVGLPDLYMIQGVYPLVKSPPVSPGQEIVGEVVAVGPGSKFSVGNRVMGTTLFTEAKGGFSEYCLLSNGRGYLAPAALSDEEAAGFVIPYKTAYAALVLRTGLKAGETLLVLGGAGSSGAAAIQLGKCLGATVIAVAGSQDKLDFCTKLGADRVINYRSGDLVAAVKAATAGKGVDVVFDPVGGATSEQVTKCIARYGRLGLVGFASGAWPKLDVVDMVLRSYSAVGVFAGGISGAEDREAHLALSKLAGEGRIKTPIARVFAFDEVLSALKLLETSPPPGKMIVRVSA